MREGFRQSLKRYNELIKDGRKIETEDPKPNNLTSVINHELQRTANARANSVETQKNVFELQKRKQAIMEELHSRLRAIDHLGAADFEPYKERTGKSRDVGIINGQLQVLENGKWNKISLGELLTDGDWGIDYLLDDRTIPRDIHKRFVVEEAKRKLQDLLDRQIVIDEISSSRIDESKRAAYTGMAEEKLDRKIKDWRTGQFAELLVQNLLKRMSIDMEAVFEILPADAYQDVNEKVDFIVRRKTRDRGVRVETHEKSRITSDKKIGIQFTINMDPAVLKRKEEQVKKARRRMHDTELTDILLVSMPADNIRQLLKTWGKKNEPHGGPISFLDRQSQRNIIGNILKHIFDGDEILTLLDSVIPRKKKMGTA